MVIFSIILIMVVVVIAAYNLPASKEKRKERDRLAYEEFQRQQQALEEEERQKIAKIRNNPAAQRVFTEIVNYVNDKKTQLARMQLSSKYMMLSIIVLDNEASYRTFGLNSWAEDERVSCYGRNAMARDGSVNYARMGLSRLNDEQLNLFYKALANEIKAKTPAKDVETYNFSEFSKIVYMDVTSWCKRTETVSLY